MKRIPSCRYIESIIIQKDDSHCTAVVASAVLAYYGCLARLDRLEHRIPSIGSRLDYFRGTVQKYPSGGYNAVSAIQSRFR